MYVCMNVYMNMQVCNLSMSVGLQRERSMKREKERERERERERDKKNKNTTSRWSVWACILARRATSRIDLQKM